MVAGHACCNQITFSRLFPVGVVVNLLDLAGEPGLVLICHRSAEAEILIVFRIR